MTRSIQLVRRIPDEPVWIRADFGLLERAVSNLLANALQFSPDQTQITLELSLGERHVLISVTDQGPGVADDRVPYLFQRFASNPAAMTHGSSTGLGLYFVQTVAHRHGGMAGYEPAAQGGARFWIELPRN